jgi:hypothetical protein
MPDLKALAQALADDDADCPGGPGCLDHEVPVRPDVILALLAIRDAAREASRGAEPDEDGDGQYIDYLVPADAIGALRAALAAYALTEGATDG